jgi:hypothetical protein
MGGFGRPFSMPCGIEKGTAQMGFFSCKHPVSGLIVATAATVESVDADFEKVTYHFLCLRCGGRPTVSHAAMRGGVDQFLKRGNVTAK